LQRTGTVIFKNWYLSHISSFHPQSDLHVAGSYVPGSHVPTLSAAPLWANDLNLEEPFSCIIQQPQRDHIQNELSDSESHLFDPSLLEQHGEEVQCIPFTTSPFTLIDIARNLPWTNAIINENFKFIPSSLKVNLVRNIIIDRAAYKSLPSPTVFSISSIAAFIYRQV
jgi:hypothetical protein